MTKDEIRQRLIRRMKNEPSLAKFAKDMTILKNEKRSKKTKKA